MSTIYHTLTRCRAAEVHGQLRKHYLVAIQAYRSVSIHYNCYLFGRHHPTFLLILISILAGIGVLTRFLITNTVRRMNVHLSWLKWVDTGAFECKASLLLPCPQYIKLSPCAEPQRSMVS
ncbi:uncharacterized protein LOC111998854 [Quercus suber]|uniref:uncharacterized protein LOC111998854 n=1 Tax=Quercus suber TaxID=58331 RepID=UPI000CE16A07|nr:uncharacterized protein LOC111998854 [Quercus suber]